MDDGDQAIPDSVPGTQNNDEKTQQNVEPSQVIFLPENTVLLNYHNLCIPISPHFQITCCQL